MDEGLSDLSWYVCVCARAHANVYTRKHSHNMYTHTHTHTNTQHTHIQVRQVLVCRHPGAAHGSPASLGCNHLLHHHGLLLICTHWHFEARCIGSETTARGGGGGRLPSLSDDPFDAIYARHQAFFTQAPLNPAASASGAAASSTQETPRDTKRYQAAAQREPPPARAFVL